jgi:putative transposase
LASIVASAAVSLDTHFPWYNGEHRHSGIGLMTPATVHHGRAQQTHIDRQRALDAAYAANPERFVRRPPTTPPVPAAAWINKPDNEEVAH